MKKFKVDIVHYFDREDSVAEIYYNFDQWVEIYQKNGKIVAKFYSPSDSEFWEFNYEDAIKALELAKSKLLAKGDEYEKLREAIAPTSEQVNAQAEKIMEEILNDPKRRVVKNSRDEVEIYAQDGRGICFKEDGSFRGFIEDGNV